MNKFTIDKLLLLLYEQDNDAEIILEKINKEYSKILLVDHSNENIYILSMDILWELQYANGYIEMKSKYTIPFKSLHNKIIYKTAEIFKISKKGKDYIKFKYPKTKH